MKASYFGSSWPTYLILSGCLVFAPALALEAAAPAITNVMQFDQWAALSEQSNCLVRLDGIVCWSDSTRERIILQDASGALLVEMDPQNSEILPGQHLMVSGKALKARAGACLHIGTLGLTNGYPREEEEQFGSISLTNGRYPIAATWFGGNNSSGFNVYYEGPGLPRQTIPDSALCRPEISKNGETNWLGGLNYRIYEGKWATLPDFQKLEPGSRGDRANFNFSMRPDGEDAGIAFDGDLNIERNGVYSFSLALDNRRQPFIENALIETVGWSNAPQAQHLVLGQILSQTGPSFWGEAEGTVTFVGRKAYGLEMELTSENGSMRAEIADVSRGMSALLMGSRIQLTGICRGAYGLNGQIVPGTVWLPDFSGIKILEMASDVWASHPVSTIHALLAANPATGTIVQVKGQVNSVNNGAIIVIHDPTGDIASRVMNSAAPAVGDFVNVVGRWDKLGTNVILDNGFSRKITRPSEASNPLPILTTAEAIKRLQRDEALRGYPVKLQGVVTWVGGSGFVIQDSTMGIFSEAVSSESAQGVHAGEYLEVEGVTTAQFSPMVLARRIVHMGLGTFPDPIRPTWDQLMNGTLDTQYAEIQGIVTAVEGRTMTLLTHDGKLQVDLPEQQNNELRGYADALIRLRGCLWAVKDEDTHKLVPGEVQMHNASISVDQAAPDDFFDAPLKQVSELLLFDAKASALQRVAVVGQMIHQREDEYFLMDGVNGMRFITRSPVSLQIGDLVKVVGFPVLGGPAPVLREAVARRINNTNLPAPRKLTENTLLDGSFDSTLVKVDAQLMNISEDHRNRFLGLQLGKHMFVACLSRKWGPIRAPIGSSLEVAGVYAGQGQDRVSGRGIDSFELLLNSPDDIRVLSRPSWWTLRRMLAVVGVMAGILTVALMWIGLLRRQVEQRTGQLREEILVRQRSEQLRVVEEERSRIARDLHDDLGASLTEISMLADAGGGAPPTIEKADSRFASIGEKARAIVNALDVIVWLVNPSKDLLPFSVSYLGSYSEEYLCAAGIACRLKVPSNIPSLRLAADLRHNLFLAIKETLNNIVRHSRATEVNMEIMLAEGRLKIGITDNGKGFSPVATADGNGLVNLEHRLAQVGGECQVTSSPETGTSVVLSIPLPAN